MARPLPANLQKLDLSQAHQFRYAFYLDTPLRVGHGGAVAMADDEDKNTFYERALRAWNQMQSHIQPLLEAAATRMEAQAAALRAQGQDARCVIHTTASRLLAGLGYKNGTEIGLSLHPLYGIPYLPAGSVKGLVRAWAEGPAGASAETLTRVFGSPSKLKEGDEASHQQGALRFYDALPAEWPRLECDVMTPHFGPYYQQPDAVPPAVWHDPNPVKFITVAAGVPFRFLMATRPGAAGARPEDLDQAERWLAEALAWLGAGGKTSAGYGRFDTDALARLFEGV